MDAERPLVIVNPRSGGGLSEAKWAKLVGGLTDGLGPFDVEFTKAPRDATAIARRAAEAGRRLVVAFGGDGTISETADGILDAGAGSVTDLGVIPRGTGGDTRRTLDLPSDLTDAARRVREGRVQVIDAGHARFVAHDGVETTRHFVNVASFGFSSAVATRANASSKRLGGRVAFLSATVRSLFAYENTDVWLEVDGAPRARRRVRFVALGNGRYFGGGMKICPGARLDSGALELVTIGDLSVGGLLLNIGKVYGGTHVSMEDVTSAVVRKVVAAPVEPDAAIPIELDGETPGRLPAIFEVLPGALRVRV